MNLQEVGGPVTTGVLTDMLIVCEGSVSYAHGGVIDPMVEYIPVLPALVQTHQLSGLAAGSPLKFLPFVSAKQLGGAVGAGLAAADARSFCCSSQ